MIALRTITYTFFFSAHRTAGQTGEFDCCEVEFSIHRYCRVSSFFSEKLRRTMPASIFPLFSPPTLDRTVVAIYGNTRLGSVVIRQ